jgi:hypothetical protein
MPADKTALMVLRRLDRLKKQRKTWESHWQEIADYMRPRKADITKKSQTPGNKRSELIFDGTAINAAELLSASLHGMLTNMSTPWFSLRFTDPAINEEDEAKEWLESTEDVLYAAFHRSNFQEQIHELYDDLILFGTGVMLIEPDKTETFRFSTRHIAECYLAEDENGRVDTVYRQFRMFARAAVSQFGADKVGDTILKTEERDPYEQVTILHVVMPRDDRDVRKMNKTNKPFASFYIEPEEKLVLSESGYNELPYCIPRWLKSSYELGYGRSPSMNALADTKVLSKMSEITLRAAQKQTDPPLMVPDDGFMLPIRTVPGGLNFYRSGTRDRLEPLNIGANNPLGLQMEEQRRQAIRAAFYVDQLIMAQGPQMTATEVLQRTEEKMRLLGPVLGRLQAELLQPLIGRCWNIMLRSKQLPVAPPMLDAADVGIEYVSPLAKAQKQTEVQAMVRMLELLQPLMGLDPGIVDHIDSDGLAKHVIKVLGIPASVTRGTLEVGAIRAQRQQQQQEQAEMQQAMQAAEAAGNAAPAVKAVDGMSEETGMALQAIAGGQAA